MQQNVNNMVVVMYVVLQCSSESTRVFTHLCVLTIKHGRICASNPHMRLKMVASAKTANIHICGHSIVANFSAASCGIFAYDTVTISADYKRPEKVAYFPHMRTLLAA